MRVCLAPRYRSPYEQPIGWLSPCGRLLKKSLGETFGAATVAGYVGPGFHTWPPGHIPQNTDPKPLPRIRASATAQRSFGDTFGAATGVSDPRLQQIRIRNHHAGGNAATVAGYVGPGFHNWPPGHIPQDTDTKPLLRIRPAVSAQNTFGEAFGAATGVSDPRLQKTQTRNRCAGGKAAAVAGYVGPGFHNWPSGHIPQDNGSETASSHPAPWQKDVRRGVRRRDRGR